MEPPTAEEAESFLLPANELLAEAQFSLFRNLPRLCVLNAYTAVELLANNVFVKCFVAKLRASGVPEELARELAEEDRFRHRTEPKFLYNRGIKKASGRSLLDDKKQQYDALLLLQELRHKVAHTGHKPTKQEAKGAHKLCCEVVQWLAEVGGLPVTPLLPPPGAIPSGFSTTLQDVQAITLTSHTNVKPGVRPSPSAPDSRSG